MPEDIRNDEYPDPFVVLPSPELVIGIVGPLGIDLDQVVRILKEELRRVGYGSSLVRLSRLLSQVSGLKTKLVAHPEHKRIRSHMSSGTELRSRTGEGGILARIAIAAIQEEREKISGSATKPQAGHAFILRSLKHKQELEDLRDVYGDGFISISAYAPKQARERALCNQLASG
jgi:cytidine deaminase